MQHWFGGVIGRNHDVSVQFWKQEMLGVSISRVSSPLQSRSQQYWNVGSRLPSPVLCRVERKASTRHCRFVSRAQIPDRSWHVAVGRGVWGLDSVSVSVSILVSRPNVSAQSQDQNVGLVFDLQTKISLSRPYYWCCRGLGRPTYLEFGLGLNPDLAFSLEGCVSFRSISPPESNCVVVVAAVYYDRPRDAEHLPSARRLRRPRAHTSPSSQHHHRISINSSSSSRRWANCPVLKTLK